MISQPGIKTRDVLFGIVSPCGGEANELLPWFSLDGMLP